MQYIDRSPVLMKDETTASIDNIIDNFQEILSDCIEGSQSRVSRLGNNIVKLYHDFDLFHLVDIILYHYIQRKISKDFKTEFKLDESLEIDGKKYDTVKVQVLELDPHNVSLSSFISENDSNFNVGGTYITTMAEFSPGRTLYESVKSEISNQLVRKILMKIRLEIEDIVAVNLSSTYFINNNIHPLNIKFHKDGGVIELIITDIAMDIRLFIGKNRDLFFETFSDDEQDEILNHLFSLYNSYCDSQLLICELILLRLYDLLGKEKLIGVFKLGYLKISVGMKELLIKILGKDTVDIIYAG